VEEERSRIGAISVYRFQIKGEIVVNDSLIILGE